MRKQFKSVQTVHTEQSIPMLQGGFSNSSAWGRRAQQAIAGVLALGMLPLSAGVGWGQDNGQQQAPPPPPDTGAQQGYGSQQQGAPPPDGYGNQQGYSGQQQVPPPADYDPQQGPPSSDYQALPPEEIDQLVAPIALYPDSLVAQVLAAATYPQQVASAEQFIQQGSNYPPDQLAQMANEQPWDPSVKSLVAFPQVVEDMNRNMSWTTQLGNAYYNQPQDVLGAVQTMRQRAYAAGNLRSTGQLSVAYNPGDIVIAPVSPSVVYVPYYNPWGVYGAPLPAYRGYAWGPPRGVAFGAGLAIGFGVGIAVGAFSHFAWGFHSWSPNWGSRTVVFNHATYISRSNTVFNHGHYGGFDRNPQARAFNHAEASRYGGGNRTTINNVNINRGGNTVNRGGQTYNRGGQNYNRGGNTFNRGGQTTNNGGSNFNRGGQTYNNNGSSFNRGGASQFNHGNPGGQPNASHENYNSHSSQGQQHSQPSHQSAPHGGGGHESHGGGDHGGDHHH